MNFKYLIALTALLSSICGCISNANNKESTTEISKGLIVVDSFKKHFDQCNVDGSIIVYNVDSQQWIVSDTIGIKMETLPASTFKIINLLIALETNTIKDENEIVKWVGSTDTVKYGYRPDIYHDMSVKEAFELSAGWVYVELAKKIGKNNYKEYLAKSGYGNNQLTQTDPDFWNFGEFAISPVNQVEFLSALYKETLPFSKNNMEIVKKTMLAEKTNDYTIYAKTGWTRENNINTGWWTGFIETKKGVYIFATRLIQDRKMNRDNFGSCRKEITKTVLRTLGIIE